MRTFLAAVATALVLAPGTVHAGPKVAMGAGVFVPYEGSAGPALHVQITGTPIQSLPGFQLGGLMEYRHYRSEFFGVRDVRADAASLRFLVRYDFLLSEDFSPYVGVAVGSVAQFIDSDRVEDRRAALGLRNRDVATFGTTFGGLALVGVRVSITPDLSVFAEGRANLDYRLEFLDIGDRDYDYQPSNVGGVSIAGGIHYRF